MTVILIDDREKNPYDFPMRKPDEITKTVRLVSGDYTIGGFENIIAFERKTFADLLDCLENDLRAFFKAMCQKQIFMAFHHCR